MGGVTVFTEIRMRYRADNYFYSLVWVMCGVLLTFTAITLVSVVAVLLPVGPASGAQEAPLSPPATYVPDAPSEAGSGPHFGLAGKAHLPLPTG